MALTFFILNKRIFIARSCSKSIETTSVIESITDIFSRLFNIGGISHSSKESGMVPNTSKLARDCPELAPKVFLLQPKKSMEHFYEYGYRYFYVLQLNVV